MEWLREITGEEILALAGGALLAFFGWELFRVVRLGAGAVAGALVGWMLYKVSGLPAPLAERGIEHGTWLIAMVLVCSLAGFILLKMISSMGSFLTGAILGFLCGRALVAFFFPARAPVTWTPPEALLGAIIGGATLLIMEKTAVVVMTSFLGSFLAGSVLPWKAATWAIFGVSAPLQWWMQTVRKKNRKVEGPA